MRHGGRAHEKDFRMFGISPLGWIHTIGSLPAIPLAFYMFVRHGRIVPRSAPGIAYFVFMLIGALPGRAARYIETIGLSLTAFLLMVPTVSEVLRRVPDGHPLVTDPKSPLLLGSLTSLLVVLVLGVAAQIIYLRRHGKVAGVPTCG
jgi:hypothetical protein